MFQWNLEDDEFEIVWQHLFESPTLTVACNESDPVPNLEISHTLIRFKGFVCIIENYLFHCDTISLTMNCFFKKRCAGFVISIFIICNLFSSFKQILWNLTMITLSILFSVSNNETFYSRSCVISLQILFIKK